MNLNKILKTGSLILLFNFFTVLAEEPSDVENLEATAMENAVDLKWDEATDPEGVVLGYRVYYGQSSYDDEDYTDDVYTESSDPYYTVTGLENGLTYYFAVTALDEEGNESINYSNEASATPVSEEAQSPSMISATQISENEIKIMMSEPVALRSKTQSFFVVEKNDPTKEIIIKNTEVEGTTVYLTTENQELISGITYEVTATSAVEDLDGNPVSSGMTDTAVFTGKDSKDFIIEDPIIEIDDKDVLKSGEILPVEKDPDQQEEEIVISHQAAPKKDIIPPNDATNLFIDTSKIELNGIVELKWSPAMDTDGDIIDQILYIKKGNENWDNGYSLGKNNVNETIEVKSNTNYMIRIVTVDKSGNQSNGLVGTFSTELSKTGSSSFLFFGIILVIGLYLAFSNKKKI